MKIIKLWCFWVILQCEKLAGHFNFIYYWFIIFHNGLQQIFYNLYNFFEVIWYYEKHIMLWLSVKMVSYLKLQSWIFYKGTCPGSLISYHLSLLKLFNSYRCVLIWRDPNWLWWLPVNQMCLVPLVHYCKIDAWNLVLFRCLPVSGVGSTKIFWEYLWMLRVFLGFDWQFKQDSGHIM